MSHTTNLGKPPLGGFFHLISSLMDVRRCLEEFASRLGGLHVETTIVGFILVLLQKVIRQELMIHTTNLCKPPLDGFLCLISSLIDVKRSLEEFAFRLEGLPVETSNESLVI